MINLSAASLAAPYRFIGAHALSVLRAITFLLYAGSRHQLHSVSQQYHL